MIATLPHADLFYAVDGYGPPMLVMHGGLGFDHTYLRPWLDPLGEQVRLVYFDHRGNGRSSEPEDWSAVTHQMWVEDADALRAHLGYDQILLLGHSYGGYLALEYALRYPERPRGLVLVGTAPVMDYPEVMQEKLRARATPEQGEALTQGLSAPIPDDAALRELHRSVLSVYFHAWKPEYAAAIESIQYRVAAFNHSVFHLLPAYDVSARLCEITCPTLIVSGDDDWFTPIEVAAERLNRGIPDADLTVIPRSGHLPFIERPEAFVSAVRDWLARNDLQSEAPL